MRTAIATVIVVCMFGLMSVLSVPSVSANEDDEDKLACSLEISIDLSVPPSGPPNGRHWQGSISGDIEGTIQLWPRPSESYNVGAVRHYVEDFVITTTSEDVVKGYESGVWTSANLKFRSNGMVTDATGDFAYLVGYETHQMGVASAFPPVPPPSIITGSAVMSLSAP